MIHRLIVTVETSSLHTEPITEGALIREIHSTLEYDARQNGIVSLTVEGPHVMTRRHFQQFADLLHEVRTATATDGERDIVRLLEERIAEYLASDNPRFNRDRFFQVCRRER